MIGTLEQKKKGDTMAMDPATLKAVAHIASSVASDEKGRWAVFIACLLPLVVILFVLSSPFAIYFAVVDGHGEVDTVHKVLNELRQEFEYRLLREQDDAEVQIVHTIVMGSEDGRIIDNSEDVLIAYAIKYNVTEDDSQQLAILSEAQINKLRQVFQEMNSISISYETTSEIVEVMSINEDDESVTEEETIETTIKTINVDCLTAEEIANKYRFNQKQTHMIAEMRRSAYGMLLSSADAKKMLTRTEIDEIKSHIPAGTVVDGVKVAEVAKSILGQVKYFWGGKSLALGRDSRWGTDMEVTSQGSVTTGSIRPYGLDCSGFVAWAFVNAGLSSDSIEQTIGQGTTTQWNHSSSILESNVLPGDLAFLAIPYTRKINHIGIVVGVDDEGQILVAHCSSGANNVVVTTAESAGFIYYRRPAVLME